MAATAFVSWNSTAAAMPDAPQFPSMFASVTGAWNATVQALLR